MANQRVQEQIDGLRALRGAADPAAVVAKLKKALTDRTGLVVAQAAKVSAELHLSDVLPDLLRAFDRLLENPIERDPQCWGKNAIARALTEFDCRDSGPFLRGSRHVQMEPVWGGKEDTASTLRGACVLALASCNDIPRMDILRCLGDCLADPAYTVRVDAARALEQMEGDEAALLLRFKARAGDVEPRVMGQVFDSLLQVEAGHALDLVRDILLNGPEEARGEAALSLGMSRLPGAVEVLQETWAATRDPDLRLAILRALSASRQEAAFDFLLGLVTKGRPRDAEDALDALSLHKDSPEIRQRVEAAARAAGSGIEELFEKGFR